MDFHTFSLILLPNIKYFYIYGTIFHFYSMCAQSTFETPGGAIAHASKSSFEKPGAAIAHAWRIRLEEARRGNRIRFLTCANRTNNEPNQ